ncbi:nucleolar protein 6 [Culex pipiens pallens]|uniref:nucleolar protein 6 n=1 Tax=Culex pipiens pallens TaxID=42434 RepID=UPI0019544032|nr:nucleolar protein 6 [Culex pipiens pallens]
MKKFQQKKQKAKPKPVQVEEDLNDSMIENGTDEDSNDEDADASPAGSDSGHESGGRFVRAPASSKESAQATKRKLLDRDQAEHQQKIKAMKQLYKPPTVEEINRLKETENFYHSNLFRLQVEQMLGEVRVKAKVASFVERWLGDFRKFLRTVKDGEGERGLDDVGYEGVEFPLEVPENVEVLQKVKFQFLQQRIVHQIGANKLGTDYGKPIVVDLLLEIPERCFHKEDYLNMRYHFKRAHFLCHLAERMVGQTKYELAGQVGFVALKGDSLKPVLEVTPSEEKFAGKVKFVIHAVAAEKFLLKRFVPEKNNVRPAMIGKEVTEDYKLCPTPHYNASILYDLRLLKNQEVLESVVQSDHVRQAIILLKVWIRQRQFNEGFYGFDGALVTFFIAYLIQNRKIYNTMSSYQIIRMFWNQMANSQWDTEEVTMESTGTESTKSYHQFYEVVFLDNSGLLNICANLSGELYRRVKRESAIAIQLLDDKKVNSFIPLFLNKYPVYTQYDHILSIAKPELIQNVLESFGSDDDKLNYFGNPHGHFRKMITQLVRRGLGPRAQFVVPIEVGEDSPLKLTLGILLNPKEAFAAVDKGPEAIDKAASEEFRNFWRGKAELRRFKDGSITESCVWGSSGDPIGTKRSICRKIVTYLLNAHFDIPVQKITYAAHQFEVSVKPSDVQVHETIEERSLACIRAFDVLSKIMKNLDSLPLTINALLGTDAVFRYSDPDPPRATARALRDERGQLRFRAKRALNATIQLEASGKWPEQLEAIRRLKTAFYLKIAEALRMYKNASVKVVPQASSQFLDVLYEGYLFRFHIVHQREINLLREYLSENKITKLYRDSDRSIQLEMRATILPKLTSILHGLHQQHFSFGSVAAMAKRWLYSQLIDPFLWPDECTELLVAALYLKQDPTLQPQAGFLRFLHYLANTDWSKELVLLNFNEEIPDEKVEELEKQFIDRRDNFPPLAIVTSCDADKFGLLAKAAPTQAVLNRVVMLAKVVITQIEENFSLVRSKVHIFYQPSFTGYDLIIKLNTRLLPPVGITPVANYTQGRRTTTNVEHESMPGFSPAECYLAELREGYRRYALFFYDHCGGDRIAVLWRPDAIEEKPFTISSVSGRMLSGKDVLQLNKDALVRDFEIVGKGLVASIERNN